MIISFGSRKLEKILSDEKAVTLRYGPEQAKKIRQRLFELQAAENLETLRTLPQVRAHELTGNRAGQISLDVKHPFRLLITPDYENPPLKEDGGFDWKRIRKVKVLKVEDTHG
ncbi:MAG: killer suppression protein [Proteobacteria bacterium]|nr:killer suppression protein [Pseudomonadota bacterium]